MSEFLSSLTASRARRSVKGKREVPESREMSAPESTVLVRPSRALQGALIALIVGVVIIPLAYLPRAAALGEWFRQTVLFVVVAVGLLSTLIHMMRRKALALPRQWLMVALFGSFAFFALLSALVSRTRYLSLYGYDGAEGYAAVTIIALFLLTGLVTVVGHDRRKIYHAWLTGSAVVLSMSALALYGVGVFPGSYGMGWTPLGSMVTLAIIAALSIVGAYGILTEYRPSRVMYGVALVASVAGLVILISINNRYGWLVLAGGSLVYLIGAGFRKEEILSRAMMAPCVGLFLALVYLFMAIPAIVRTPLEPHITFRESIRIARTALKIDPVFGSGPATYATTFFKLRNPEIIQVGFAQQEFHSGAGSLLTFLVTLGALGALLWSALTVLALFVSGRGIVRDRRTGGYLAVQSVLFTAVMAALLLPVTFHLLFIIALFLGLSLAEGAYREISMARSERGIAMRNAAVAAVLLVLVVGTIVLLRRTGGVYFAFRTAQAFAQNSDKTGLLISRALMFDNAHDGYWRMLADARRMQVNFLSSQLGGNAPSPEVANTYQVLTAEMVDAAKHATVIAPGSALNWSSLGQTLLVAGLGNAPMLMQAHTAFDRARELNQYNPGIITALGVTERLQAFANANGGKPDNTKAIALLEQATSLQPSYVQAHIELARLYASAEDTEKAFASYAKARLAAPYDPAVAYEVALYLREQKEYEKAVTELERALTLAPNFAQAHLVLSEIYTFTGDNQKAVEHIAALVKLFPENKELQTRLESLKAKAAEPVKKKK